MGALKGSKTDPRLGDKPLGISIGNKNKWGEKRGLNPFWRAGDTLHTAKVHHTFILFFRDFLTWQALYLNTHNLIHTLTYTHILRKTKV